MIRFVICGGHDYTLDDISKAKDGPSIDSLSYDELIGSRRLPWATYVFTDFDRLAYSDLELAGRIYQQLKSAGLKVLNDPAVVKMRYALLRALRHVGFNDFSVFPGDEIPEKIRFPVYIRKCRGHGPPCTDLIETREEIERALEREALSGVPAGHLMIVEYAGEPIRPNLYRKWATFCIGSSLTPSPCVHDHKWLVKTGPNCIADEDLYDEDFRNIRENPHSELLRKAFALARIEYGRADYGFYNGRLQIFEINTNPHIVAPKSHPSATRMEAAKLAWRQTLSAFHSIDSLPGRDIALPKDDLLNRHRKWTKVFHKSRPVS